MLKKRNAVGLPVNVIILAVIALVVLIVVIAIFTSKTGESVGTLNKCESRGGECQASGEDCKGPKIPNICPTEGDVCCITI